VSVTPGIIFVECTLIIPPFLCFHFLTFWANTALLTNVGLPEALALAIHSPVTVPPQ